MPTVVRFLDGSSTVTPRPADYESTDRDLVFASAALLSKLGGDFRSALIGNAGFIKVDAALSPRHYPARLSTSRYSGENNVFFDPASPVTSFAISENAKSASPPRARCYRSPARSLFAPPVTCACNSPLTARNPLPIPSGEDANQ